MWGKGNNAIPSHKQEPFNPGMLAQGGGWLFPVSPNWTALTSTQTTPTRQPPAPAAPLLLSLLPSGTVSHPFFSQGDIPKVQNLELEQRRGGVMGSKSQHVPSLPGHNSAPPIPAPNPSASPRAQTKPVQPETGLPAPTCPTKADLVRNVTGKAAGTWNQSLCLGMCQSCPEHRDV